MKLLIVFIAIVVIIAIGVIVSLQTPDIDRIIAEKDCNAVRSLTADDYSKTTADQALKLGALQASCMFGG